MTCGLAGLVERRARRDPALPAVVDGRTVLSFAALDRAAAALAGRLQRLGVAPEEPVALCCGRSAAMAVGFLGIARSGAACVPVDPAHPADRQRFVASDSAVRVVVTRRGDGRALEGGGRVRVLLDADDPAGPPAAPSPVDADGVGYVLYTSGSTGRPKGVSLTHRGLVNHTVAMADLFGLAPGDRVLQFASIAFDLSVEELFPPWHAGATVVIRPPRLPVLGPEWLRWLTRRRITVMDLPTGYWERWVADLASAGNRVPDHLRLLVVGGEQPSPRAYATWLEAGGDGVRWLNTYGPTEATIVSTWYEPPRHPVAQLPIGRPIPNVTAHVLDATLAPVPAGSVGELYLGGVGVARGYVGRPDLTSERFVPDPFAGAGARLFRTGDRARRRPDGTLEFLGRLDHQVKVRGARVEPGEVEVALTSHPAVHQAVVVGREQPADGGMRLLAYCVAPHGLPAPAELRSHLARTLPDQLVPSAFVPVASFPLTANGKVDRAALPAPPARRPELSTAPTPARTRTEAVLAAVWAEVLGVDEVGVHDDFFELGGHSLLAFQAAVLAGERLGVELPAAAVMHSPTVAAVARRAEAASVPAGRRGVAAGRSDRLAAPPLSLQEEWMWELEARSEPQGLFNVAVHDSVDGPVDLDALRAALRALVARHDVLRTTYHEVGGLVRPRLLPAGDVQLGETDLSGVDAALRPAALAAALVEESGRPFDLACGPPFRARAFRLGDATDVALTFDHLVADGVSVGLLLSELRQAYRAVQRGRAPELPRLALGYREFARWQRRHVAPGVVERETSYWRRQLGGMSDEPGLPFDHRPDRPHRATQARLLDVPPSTVAGLRALARRTSASLFPVCVAAVQAVVTGRRRSTDAVVSTMLGGRPRPELEGVVGLFAGASRLRTDLGGGPSFAEAVARCRATLLGALEHHHVPFGRVRRALVDDAGGPEDRFTRPENLPVDVQYLPAAWDTWYPGAAVLARHPRHGLRDHDVVRGQRHPLMVAFYDDRRELWAWVSYKPAFYDDGTIEGFIDELGVVLAAGAARPDEPVPRLVAP